MYVCASVENVAFLRIPVCVCVSVRAKLRCSKSFRVYRDEGEEEEEKEGDEAGVCGVGAFKRL